MRYCEGYHVPWLFLSTLMNFNFNPQTYDFTSGIPDVFEMSDFQGSSVYLATCLNRSQSPIFSTTLYAHGEKASIYDLRSIIENYMEAKQLVYATCSFRMQVDRIDYTLGEFMEFKLQMLRTNCDLFLQSHFLTTHAVRLVPHGFQLDLQYIVFPGESTYKKCLREEWGKFTGYQLLSSFWLKVARTDEDGKTTRWDRGTLPIRNLYPKWWMLRFGRIRKVTNWIWMLWFIVSY